MIQYPGKLRTFYRESKSMNYSSKYTLIALTLLSVLLALQGAQEISSPTNPNDLSKLGEAEKVTLPRPTYYPFPRVNKLLAGSTVRLKLMVTEKGLPECVELEKRLYHFPFEELKKFASQMQTKVSTWKFEPAHDSFGNPVTVKIIMPVHVLKKGGQLKAAISLLLNEEETNL